MPEPILYSDALIEITPSRVTFRHYGIFGGDRRVLHSDIEKITVKESSLWTGKYRIHGTGNFKIWFPRDARRPERDRIFFAFLKGKRRVIGFTVERAADVQQIFQASGLIRRTDCPGEGKPS